MAVSHSKKPSPEATPTSPTSFTRVDSPEPKHSSRSNAQGSPLSGMVRVGGGEGEEGGMGEGGNQGKPNIQVAEFPPTCMASEPHYTNYTKIVLSQLALDIFCLSICLSVHCWFWQILSRPVTVRQLGATIREPGYLESEFRVCPVAIG